MENVKFRFLDEVRYDISNYKIRGLASDQYSLKCSSGLSMLEASVQMRKKMQSVRRIELLKREKQRNKNRISFMDEDEIIYIVEKDTVITTFPKERIFVAKTLYFNKKTGNKYL